MLTSSPVRALPRDIITERYHGTSSPVGTMSQPVMSPYPLRDVVPCGDDVPACNVTVSSSGRRPLWGRCPSL